MAWPIQASAVWQAIAVALGSMMKIVETLQMLIR